MRNSARSGHYLLLKSEASIKRRLNAALNCTGEALALMQHSLGHFRITFRTALFCSSSIKSSHYQDVTTTGEKEQVIIYAGKQY